MPNIVMLANEEYYKKLSYSENATLAWQVSLEGILVVFAVLAILWGCIELMHRLVYKPEKKTEEQPVTEKKDDAVVAVITAAISAQMVSEGKKPEFTVKRIRRAPRAPHKPIPW